MLSQEKEARISVALCTFNGATYLDEQLESIARQSLQPIEIVISDDGSSDETCAVVKRFVAAHPELTIRFLVNTENLHFTGNFLYAASMCSGEYIAFSDQDDVWYPEKLELSVQDARRSGSDLTIHQARVVDAAGCETPQPLRPQMGLEIGAADFNESYTHFVLGCCFLVRKSVIDEILAMWDWEGYAIFRREFGFLVGHDMLIFALCFGRGSVNLLREPLIDYRVHDSNVTAVDYVSMTRLERLAFMLGNLTVDPERYRRSAKKWDAEGLYLDAMLSRSEKSELGGLAELRDMLKRKSTAWRLRGDVVDLTLPLRQRLSAWWDIARKGFYTSGKRGLGVTSLSMGKDILYIAVTGLRVRPARRARF